MDYNKHSCPVCKKAFENGDDIVVCPECGAPHHRDCYELSGHCYYEDKHAEGFDFRSENDGKTPCEPLTTEEGSAEGKCAFCGQINPQGSKFCNGCGMPLDGERVRTHYDRHNDEQAPPYRRPEENAQQNDEAQPPFTTFAFDPLGGIKADTEVGQDVTAGEAAKFVKNNTPFYSRLFYQIKKAGRSRFSFVGFLFSGGWMLYRKMYLRGAVVTLIMAAMMLAQLYIGTFYNGMLNEFIEAYESGGMFVTAETMNNIDSFFRGLDIGEAVAFGTYYVATMGQLVVRVICGIFCNRWYYGHCMKKISDIKSKADSKEEADKQLQTKGGVNMALALCIAFSYLLISILPSILSGGIS